MAGSTHSTPENHSLDHKSSASSIKDAASRKSASNASPAVADASQPADLEKAEAKPAPTPGGVDPSSFPDGGLEAWLVVSGGFASLFSSFGWINAIGVFQTEWEKNQLKEYSPSAISWIPSLEVFFMFAGGPIAGKLYDDYGPRGILLVGSFLHVFGLMMSSISTEYYQFLLSQGICSPIGACLIFYSAMSSVGTWFHKYRALSFGVMASGSSLGGVVFPIMVPRIIERSSYGWAMRACAFLILGLQTYSVLTIKSRLPPTPRPWKVMAFLKPYTETTYALIVAASGLFFFGMFLPFTFIILSAEHYGMSARLAGYLLAILNAASTFGRILPGFMADRFGRFNAMIVISSLSTILVLAVWIPARGNVAFIIFAAFYGFATGAFVSLAPALVAQISRIEEIGIRTGSMFMFISVAALVGNPIGGQLLIEDHGSYLHLQLFCGIVMGAGACFFVAARVSNAHDKRVNQK